MGVANWVRRHWVVCLIAFVAIASLALIVLWVVGDLKFAEFLALLVGVVSFPVGVVALRLANHTDDLLTAMANGQFDHKASSLQHQRHEIEGGTLNAAVPMATDVKALSRIASVADEDVKSKLMSEAVLPAIETLASAEISQSPIVRNAAAELARSAKNWGVLEDKVDQRWNNT